ncbi:discoidin domain-containing protein [Actinopolymorpha alba]|uniref:discoidin domain-containing protein n=1 Tax=Actinopolymorpha alba TaxID=533267 RepID=UPI00036376C3|nr:discoidin domain-containing protein [Actinopolymorpha alba]
MRMRAWGTTAAAALLTCSVGIGATPSLAETSSSHDAPLAATRADEWTQLFNRTSGWLGADGIFSVPLDGRDGVSEATPSSRTMFIFSDTRVGTADPFDLTYEQTGFLNNSSAVLNGNQPNPKRASFVTPAGGAFRSHDWMNDGIAIGDTVYATGFAFDSNWNASRVDLFSMPIVGGVPDYSSVRRTEDVGLLIRNSRYIVMFGVGIMDNSAVDGYVYVYGYRNTLLDAHKDLVVARVPRADFADMPRPDGSASSPWRFWSGSEWSPDISVAEHDAAVLHSDVSTELSVTPITTGRYAGKYLLVYTRNVMSTALEYAVGDTPNGPFSAGVRFYNCPEPYIFGSQTEGMTYCYNAKAHPSLSEKGRLLVSYNVNRIGGDPLTTEIYRPRFVWLDLNKPATTPPAPRATTNLAAGRPTSSSRGQATAAKATDGTWDEFEDGWSADAARNAWLSVDLGATRKISGYRVKHAGYGGSPFGTALNTRDFSVELSDRPGGPWRTVDAVTGNTENLTDRLLPNPVSARYVRLRVTKPTQTADSTTRVLEFEVLSDAGASPPNLALYKPVTADSANSSANHVTDAQLSDPELDAWVNPSGHGATWLAVDLGSSHSIGRYVVKHAQAGGLDATLNTRDFVLQSSDNNKQWTNRDSVLDNGSAVTDRTVPTFTARYVRLLITKPVADSVDEKTTRVYELEVYPPSGT